MKMVRDTTGRFPKRPHYEPAELDRECESIVSNFLRKKYGEIRYPLSTGDLGLLIENEADDLDQFADLREFGPGVEGVTIFNPGSKPHVKIASDLASSPNRENRLRTTLAHEYGHVHFHAYLFDSLYSETDLFAAPDSSSPARVQVCKRDTMVDAAYSDWMEWQAGHVCGAVLMPAGAVRGLVRSHFPDAVNSGSTASGSAAGTAMISAISESFQVSLEAGRIRLIRLKVLNDGPITDLLI